jgi:protoporphyrin/coproporphyrin ferrochelatase
MSNTLVMPMQFGEAIDQPQPLAQSLATGPEHFVAIAPADFSTPEPPPAEPPTAMHEPEISSAAAPTPSLAIAPAESLAISAADALKIMPAAADGFAANAPTGAAQLPQTPPRNLSSVGPALAPSLALAPADSLAIAPAQSLTIGPVLSGAPAAKTVANTVMMVENAPVADSLAIAPADSLALAPADSLKIAPASASGFATNTPRGVSAPASYSPARETSPVAGPAPGPSPAIAPARSLAIAPADSLVIGPALPGKLALDGAAAVASKPAAPPREPASTVAPPHQSTAEVDAPAPAPSTPVAKPATAGKTTTKQDAPAKPEVVEGGIGVLLVNLGTPDAPTPEAVRRYLKQFLTDPRVIERNSWFWKLLLYGLILPIRSRRKARDYQKIWNNEKNESPFKTITRSQAEKLASILEPLGKHVIVDWAMRYGNPSIASRLEVLTARGCDRILIMPLYPQYAAPTTATVCDEVFRFMMQQRRQPALRVLPPYYDDPYYIEVLASSLQAELKALPFTPEVIIASYHGMPKDYVVKGDPYEGQCVWTTQLLRQKLGFDETKLMMTFQSRFGRGQWLEPYTISTVKSLAKKGVKNLVMLLPGFSADCLETLEEIAVENARVFKRYGGQNFVAIPCLNDGEAGMLMIWQLAMRELKGWV